MKIELLYPDPDLEFGLGRCQDIRFGIGRYGVFDFADAEGPRQIRLGFVGTNETLTSLTEWLTKCQQEIPAKPSNQPKLYPPFPGFSTTHSFHSGLVWNRSDYRVVNIPQDINRIQRYNARVEAVVDLYAAEIEKVIERSGAHVILCAPPLEHLKVTRETGDEEISSEQGTGDSTDVTNSLETDPDDNSDDPKDTEDDESITKYDFHDLLKAKTLHLRTPIQLVLPATYDESKLSKQKKLINRDQQDEATRAWNLFTALYYKARGIPWRLRRQETDVRTCYLGVSFFRTLDQKRVYASSAQVFNELGEGMIVRGGLAYQNKDNREIHLDRDESYKLALLALEAFKDEHHHYPGRVVVHKTSRFTAEEFDGFRRFFEEKEISQVDCLYVSDSDVRLFRSKNYPPLRGTLWTLEDRHAVLYTRGSVPFYETYPGRYPPRTLRLDCNYTQRSLSELARECLELTKMNWNNTRFDGQLPITLRAARQVGGILKYLEGEDTKKISKSYRFYM